MFPFSPFLQPNSNEVRALRELYVALDKRIRALENEKLKTAQIVEASHEVRKRSEEYKKNGWGCLV